MTILCDCLVWHCPLEGVGCCIESFVDFVVEKGHLALPDAMDLLRIFRIRPDREYPQYNGLLGI